MSAEGEEIRHARRVRKMTQKQLAAASGVGLRTITRIETGEAEGDGKEAETASLVVLQKFLRVGPYTPETGQSDDPPLSKASFTELVQAIVTRHGNDMRDAVTIALSAVQPVQRDIGRRPVRNGNGNGLMTPNYDPTTYTSRQDSDRANHEDETG